MGNLDKFKPEGGKLTSSKLDKFTHAQLGMRLGWWDYAKDDQRMGRECFSQASSIFDRQTPRIQRLWEAALLYGGIQPDMRAILGPLAIAAPRGRRSSEQLIRINVIRRVIDAATAQVTRSDVRPLHLPQGGSWGLLRRSKKLNRYSDGQMRKFKMRSLGPNIFRDACIFDMGALKVFSENGEPVLDRTLSAELVVDGRDGRYNKPRMMYQRRWVDVAELAEKYPDQAVALKSSGRDEPGDDFSSTSVIDQVETVEAWRLPRNGSPGRHVVCVRNATLLDEVWDRERFPFALLKYSSPLTGFYGESMEQHLRGLQIQVNLTLRSIQQSLHMGAVPRAFIPRGSRIVPSHITNEVLSLIEYDPAGGPPIFHPGVAFPPQLAEHLLFLIEQAFDQEGVSRMAASSEKSPGLHSGAGIRAERDLGTERFSLASKAYEQWALDVDELLLDETRALTKAGKKVFVLVPRKGFSEKLEFKDVDIARDQYDLGTYPTNLLPSTPEGRLDSVQDMLQGGMIDATEGRRLLEVPDLESVTDLDNAALDNILATIERTLDGLPYKGPEPFQALELGIKTFQSSYLKAVDDGAPEDVLEDLRRWIDEAQAMLTAAAPPQSPAGPPAGPPALGAGPGAPPAGPLGVPGAPPVSPLLPTVPPAA